MPSTSSWKLPVARKESRPGISMEKISLGAVERADREDREAGIGLGLVEGLCRSHFHRLDLGHDLALDVAGDHDADARRRARPRRRCAADLRYIERSAACDGGGFSISHSETPMTNGAAGHVGRR
jgi:hypothetical protein